MRESSMWSLWGHTIVVLDLLLWACPILPVYFSPKNLPRRAICWKTKTPVALHSRFQFPIPNPRVDPISLTIRRACPGSSHGQLDCPPPILDLHRTSLLLHSNSPTLQRKRPESTLLRPILFDDCVSYSACRLSSKVLPTSNAPAGLSYTLLSYVLQVPVVRRLFVRPAAETMVSTKVESSSSRNCRSWPTSLPPRALLLPPSLPFPLQPFIKSGRVAGDFSAHKSSDPLWATSSGSRRQQRHEWSARWHLDPLPPPLPSEEVVLSESERPRSPAWLNYGREPLSCWRRRHTNVRLQTAQRLLRLVWGNFPHVPSLQCFCR